MSTNDADDDGDERDRGEEVVDLLGVGAPRPQRVLLVVRAGAAAGQHDRQDGHARERERRLAARAAMRHLLSSPTEFPDRPTRLRPDTETHTGRPASTPGRVGTLTPRNHKTATCGSGIASSSATGSAGPVTPAISIVLRYNCPCAHVQVPRPSVRGRRAVPSRAISSTCSALEVLQAGRAVRREHEPDLALVGAIRAPLDEPRGHGPVDELDRAVVAQQEVVRHVPHRRTFGVTVTAHRQHAAGAARGSARRPAPAARSTAGTAADRSGTRAAGRSRRRRRVVPRLHRGMGHRDMARGRHRGALRDQARPEPVPPALPALRGGRGPVSRPFTRVDEEPPRGNLLALVVVVGLASGLAGAAFVGTLRGLTELIGPSNWNRWAELGVLAATGLVIAVLTRLLGNPGDVELLVDNIHVCGGRDDIRDLRSLVPVSIVWIAAGSAIGPEAPLVQTTGSIGSWIARRYDLDRSGPAHPDHHRDGRRVHGAVRRAPRLRDLRPRDPAPARARLRRGARPGDPRRAVGLRGLCLHHRAGPRAGLELSPRPPAARCSTSASASSPGSAARSWPSRSPTPRAASRAGFRRMPAFARPVIGGVALGGLAFAVAVRADLRREPDRARARHAPPDRDARRRGPRQARRRRR